ncbi:MAG: glycosyltransferase family 2 protein [Nitrososphaerota archaeon]
MLQYIAFFCWSVFSVFVVLGIVAQVYKTKKSRERAKNVECVIVSVANHKVEKALFECIEQTKKLNIPLRILVDEGSELIPKLSGLSLVIVPSSYRKDLVGKGRAINYFIETEVQEDKWYAFIDDDNLILDDSFLYEIPYYESKGYVAMNPILIPREGKSKLVYVMDSIRYFDDLTSFRFFTGLLKRPLIGFHGELLAVKGKVLKEIGFNRRSLAEDFYFASELVRRGYKTWQSTTKVSIKSPNSIGDFLRQRGRWFKGIAEDLKDSPALMKAIVGLRLIVWILGIFGSWAMSLLWLLWDPFYLAIPGGIYYWITYLYGVINSRKFYYFFLIPIFGILESVSFLFGIKQKNFVVIDKS